MYPDIRAVQARRGKHKLPPPLPAEASEGEPGYDDYMVACTVRFLVLFNRVRMRSALAQSRVSPSLIGVCLL